MHVTENPLWAGIRRKTRQGWEEDLPGFLAKKPQCTADTKCGWILGWRNKLFYCHAPHAKMAGQWQEPAFPAPGMSQAPVLIQGLLSRDDGALRGSTGHESPLDSKPEPPRPPTTQRGRLDSKTNKQLTAGATKGVRPQEHVSSTPGVCIWVFQRNSGLRPVALGCALWFLHTWCAAPRIQALFSGQRGVTVTTDVNHQASCSEKCSHAFEGLCVLN